MNQAGRAFVTLVIWIGVFSVLGTTFTSVTGPIANMGSSSLLGFAAILIIGAGISTVAIWKDSSAHAEDTRASKLKRAQPSRVQKLISELDDDEVYELETLLLARDDQQQSSTRR